MGSYQRLRQVCLAAPHLEASTQLLQSLLGLEECHRDPAVAAYGLENALLTIGPDRFLEVVCPTEPGTAAGRFMEGTGGLGGYMLIFDCDDAQTRRDRITGMGVRLAHHIDRPMFQGFQYHPKDCRATFLEFDNTVGGEDVNGAYWPAGEHWRDHVKTDVTRALLGVEVLTPDPAGLAAHWSRIMDVPASGADGRHVIRVDAQEIAFLSAPGVARERLDALVFSVVGAADILHRARCMGLETREGAFLLGGCWMKLVEAG